MDRDRLNELLFQALETERGAASRCTRTRWIAPQNDDLKKEWTKYLEQTTNHEVVMLRVLDAFGLDADTETPGRAIVRQKGQGLVKSMQDALAADPVAAQLVAAECVVEAETKDHMNWELIGEAAKKLTGAKQGPRRKPTTRWRKRKTSTCTTPWAGPESCGSSSSACRRPPSP